MNAEECSSQPFRGRNLKSYIGPILLSNETCRMSAGIRRKTLSIYRMVCRFEQVVSCEVQSTYDSDIGSKRQSLECAIGLPSA